MLEVDEALARVLDGVEPLSTETVSCSQAYGRVSAVEVYATRPQPPFSNSAMDGYAVRTTDLRGEPPYTLNVIGESAAGRRTPITLGPHESVRIFTGGPMPEGADAVVIQEDTQIDGNAVRTTLRPKSGDNLRPRGADISDGQCLIRRGEAIRAGEIANLLTQGVLEPKVFRRPRVHLVSTGNELVAPGREPKFGEITNASIPMLAAAARESGAIAVEMPTIPDDLELIKVGFAAAVKNADLLVVTGGMSVGDYDFAARAMAELGSVSFHKIRMKPGKPLAFGRIGDVAVLGLPGNPVSSYVGFELFGRPLLRALGGHNCIHRRLLSSPLGRAVRRNRTRPEYIRGAFRGAHFVPHTRQGSSDLSSVLGVDGLGRIDSGEGLVPEGEIIPVIDLRS